MSDNNLSSSITALVNQIKTEIPTSSAENLKRLARSIRKLGHSGDSTIDTLINTRANALVASATPSELQILSEAVNLVDDTSNPTAATNVNADVHVSDTAPASAVSGDLWWKTDELNLYIYYEDTDGAQWIQANSTVITGTIPTDVSDLTDSTSLLGSGGASVVATHDLLPSSPSAGDMALVSSVNKMYVYFLSGWWLMSSLQNASPSGITGNAALYDLAADGTPTTVTLSSSDPEGFPISWSHSVISGSLGGTTVTNVDNVFTITPSTTVADAGTFTLRFAAADGQGGESGSQSNFTLDFVFTVTNSRYTTLLATAVDTSDNNNITDSSSNSHSITVSGDAHAGTFSPYRSGGYSTYFDGTGDYLETTSSNYALGTSSAFTLEFWYYFDEDRTHTVFDFYNSSNGAVGKLALTSGNVYLYDGSANILALTRTQVVGSWEHFCWTRDTSNNHVFYINGTQVGTSTASTNIDSQTLNFGRRGGSFNNTFMKGYLSDVRLVKGTVITPPSGGPTERLEAVTNTSLLTCHLPYIADGSTNDHSITVNGDVSTKPFSPYDYTEYSAADHGGSVYFDGSNDDLTITDHSAFDLSTGNWTVEFWWNPKSVNTNEGPMTVGYGSGSTPTGLKFAWENNKLFAFSMDGSTLQTGLYHDATAASLVNRWNHVAAVYNGSNTDLYLNGVASGRAQSTNFGENSSDDVRIGSVRRLSSIHYSECSISDVRIVKGTAVYSGNFTPPTGPLTTTGGTYPSTTNVNTSITASNTSLLIKGTDASIIDKSGSAALKLYGGAVSSTAVSGKFPNTNVIKVTGTSDYFIPTYSPVIGTNDYTIECWLYETIRQNYSYLFDFRPSNTNGDYLSVRLEQAQYNLYVGSSHTQRIVGGSSTWNGWAHFALARSGSQTKMFSNGTQIGNTWSASTNLLVPDNTPAIGRTNHNTYSDNAFRGYIQDFRITVGNARYTSNFTPPSEPLEG